MEVIADGFLGTSCLATGKDGVRVVKWLGIGEEEGSRVVLLVQELVHLAEHENVNRYKGAGIQNGEAWISTAKAEGGSCGRLRGNIGEEALAEIVKEIIAGLEHLHANGIAHGDLHAENLLLSGSGTVLVSDYGLAEALVHPRSLSARNATVPHPPWWTAPEILQETSPSAFRSLPPLCSFKADIWALGATIIELAEGKPPLSDLHPDHAVRVLQKGLVDVKLQNLSKWSLFMSDLVAKCLSPLPMDRPSLQELKSHRFLLSASPVALLSAVEALPTLQATKSTGLRVPRPFDCSDELERVYRSHSTLRIPYLHLDAFPPELFDRLPATTPRQATGIDAQPIRSTRSMLPALTSARDYHLSQNLLPPDRAFISQTHANELDTVIRNIRRE